MVARLLARSSWRFHRHHPLQLILSMFGIILGVGIVTSVLITNHSAVRAFALSSDALYGKATHQIVAANGLNDVQAAEFIKSHPRKTIAPIVETELIINQELITLIGLDPFRESQFSRLQTSAVSNNQNLDLSRLSIANNPVWASEASAERLQLTVGDELPIDDLSLSIAGIFKTASRAASEGLLITDISIAQTLANQLGKIDRLELILNDVQAKEIASNLPVQWRLQATAQRQDSNELIGVTGWNVSYSQHHDVRCIATP